MKKIITKSFGVLSILSVVLFSACAGDSPEPTKTQVPANGKLYIAVFASEAAADEGCRDDKSVILELDADHLTTKKTYTKAYKISGNTYEQAISYTFTDLRAGAYTLSVKYRKGTSGTIYKKGDYSITITETQAKNGTELEQNYTLVKDDLCY